MKLLCPKCKSELYKNNNSYICENRHTYDIAKEGYINLVLANQKHSDNPGDSADSLVNRKKFLENGYYQPLADALAELINKYMNDGECFLDAGTGTGYYLNNIIRNSKHDLEYYGCDLAKKGVAMSAKANKEAMCFVGNIFHLPFRNEAINGLISVFCPYSSEEFYRVMAKNGYIIAVTSGKRHLYELKEIVYDEPYENNEQGYNLDGFERIECFNVTYNMVLKNNEDINTLWKMMPYYHRTKKSDSDKLLTLEKADCTADFMVEVFRKNA